MSQNTSVENKKKQQDKRRVPRITKYSNGSVAEVKYHPVDKMPAYMIARNLGGHCGMIAAYLPRKFGKISECLLYRVCDLQEGIMVAYQELDNKQKRIELAKQIFPLIRKVLSYLRIIFDNNVMATLDYNRAVEMLVAIESKTKNWVENMEKAFAEELKPANARNPGDDTARVVAHHTPDQLRQNESTRRVNGGLQSGRSAACLPKPENC